MGPQAAQLTGSDAVSVNDTLTGICLHPGLACSGDTDPSQCPVGAVAKDPGSVQCGWPIDRATVDLSRSCGYSDGYCEVYKKPR